jgi:hypothetical protein
MHVRATARTGASKEDVMQAFLHVAVYAGVPKANHAIKLAKDNDLMPRWRDLHPSRTEQRPRAATVIARPTAPRQYRFVTRLEGAGETVFLDL